MRRTIGVIVGLFLGLAAQTGIAGSSDIDLATSDGVALKATYSSPGKPGPGMLLVHQCNMDRKSWGGIAEQLTAAGIHVLTIDLRGFGDSGGAGIQASGGFGPFLATSSGDVDLAYDYLASQDGVDATTIGVGGASCGAMLTADLASRKDGVKALMLLSGPPSDAAIAHMAATPGLAVFAAAASGDTITKGVHERLQGAVDGSKNSQSVAKIYDGPEHGLPMFAKNADLEPALVAWIKSQLL